MFRPCTRCTLRTVHTRLALETAAPSAPPVAVGAMNIHDVCDRRHTDTRETSGISHQIASSFNVLPIRGGSITNEILQ